MALSLSSCSGYRATNGGIIETRNCVVASLEDSGQITQLRDYQDLAAVHALDDPALDQEIKDASFPISSLWDE